MLILIISTKGEINSLPYTIDIKLTSLFILFHLKFLNVFITTLFFVDFYIPKYACPDAPLPMYV